MLRWGPGASSLSEKGSWEALARSREMSQGNNKSGFWAGAKWVWPLWAAGDQLCWGSLGDGAAPHSELYPPRSNKVEVCIHQLGHTDGGRLLLGVFTPPHFWPARARARHVKTRKGSHGGTEASLRWGKVRGDGDHRGGRAWQHLLWLLEGQKRDYGSPVQGTWQKR